MSNQIFGESTKDTKHTNKAPSCAFCPSWITESWLEDDLHRFQAAARQIVNKLRAGVERLDRFDQLRDVENVGSAQHFDRAAKLLVKAICAAHRQLARDDLLHVQLDFGLRVADP